MLLTDHVQAIIKSAKSIVAARNFPELAPEHLMLALMLDQNDLPKILFERVGADNPQIVDRLNNYLSKRAYYARGKFSDVRLSADTIAVMNIASDEAEKRNDEQISIEHLMLALFRIDNKTLNYLWEQSGINRLELYEKMTEEVNNIINVEETQTASGSINNGEEKNSEPAKPVKSDIKNSKKNDALEKYTTDLTECAKNNKLDPVIGRDDEIRRTIQILNRRSKNNPVIIGEPGVGKTAIIEGLAQRIVSGDVPETLKNDKILLKYLLNKNDEFIVRTLIYILEKNNLFVEVSFGTAKELKKSVDYNKPWIWKINSDYEIRIDYDFLALINKKINYSLPTENEIVKLNKSSNLFDLLKKHDILEIKPAKVGYFYKINENKKTINRIFIDQKMPHFTRNIWPAIFDKNNNIVYMPRYRKKYKINNNSLLIFDVDELYEFVKKEH